MQSPRAVPGKLATAPSPTRITYFVHDINDPAVTRRVRMLHAGGASVLVAGFRRDDRIPETIDGARVIDLGLTGDARLVQRAAMVLRHVVRPGAILAAGRDASVIIGRNLEALALATRSRRGVPAARLVYECLDIHRTLSGASVPARAIQWVEGRLLAGIDLLIVSSPAFLRDYFSHRPTLRAPCLLVENKLLALGEPLPLPLPPASKAGPPWTIGWFGNLRCRRTFDELRALAVEQAGRVRILIAGRPSGAEFDDFPAMVAAAPHCTYVGAFTPRDLSGLYAQCHFAWAIDYFEEGLNSTWLLPNRLYEAGSFGVVPIAARAVETGRWLAAHGAGLLLDKDDPLGQLRSILGALDEQGYDRLHAAIDAIPRGDLIADEATCVALTRTVAGA